MVSICIAFIISGIDHLSSACLLLIFIFYCHGHYSNPLPGGFYAIHFILTLLPTYHSIFQRSRNEEREWGGGRMDIHMLVQMDAYMRTHVCVCVYIHAYAYVYV